MKPHAPALQGLAFPPGGAALDEADEPEVAVGDSLRVAARAATSAGNSAAFAAEAILNFASQVRAFSAAWEAGRSPNASSVYLALGEASALLAGVQREFETASATLTALQVRVARADED